MSAIFESILSDTFSVSTYLVCLLCAGICGILTALAISYRNPVSKSFFASLVILPIVVSTVILMVNGNVGTGIAVAGAFSLVRFRSVAGKARDIAVIFLVMTSGLACAAGYIGIAILFTILLCVLILILSQIPFGSDRMMELHITVPETLNFSNAFDDLFKQYAKQWKLVKTRTSNMGSLYKLHYRIELKHRDSLQAFMDELRCRNGNLEIAIMDASENADEL